MCDCIFTNDKEQNLHQNNGGNTNFLFTGCWHSPNNYLFCEALGFYNLPDFFFLHCFVIFFCQLQVEERGSAKLLLPDTQTSKDSASPERLFVMSLSVFISLCPFKTPWHLIFSDVNAPLDNLPFPFLQFLLSLTCEPSPSKPLARGCKISITLSLRTFSIAHRPFQGLWLSEGWGNWNMKRHSAQDVASNRWWLGDATSGFQFTKSGEIKSTEITAAR